MPRRIRKVLKWVSVSATLVVAAAAVVSLKVPFRVYLSHSTCGVTGGMVRASWGWPQPFVERGFDSDALPEIHFVRSWRPRAWTTPGGPTVCDVPLYIPVAALATISAFLWTRDTRRRRIAAGLCAACAYDRRGLAADAKCPECGTIPAPANK